MKYFCINCGAEFLRWSGKCPSCGEWESLKEVEEEDSGKGEKKNKSDVKAFKITEINKSVDTENRISTGFAEFDRVLGGGIVGGSITLLAGEPGVGKSTLLTQIAINLSKASTVLYISGEESAAQIYSRVKRLGNNIADSKLKGFSVSDETNVENIESLIQRENPTLVIIDSIQSLSSTTLRSYAGSIGQVRVCGAKLTRVAKDNGIPIFLVGQMTKEGSVAGPKVLEHIVDTVLYIEGGEYNIFRVLRSAKNRFGATDEIGVFEMQSEGLVEVPNPSKAFLEGGSWGAGSSIGAIHKGSRVVLVEVQALVVEHGGEAGPLRRIANGIRKPRLDMLCAVMSRRGGVFLGDKDVFINVVGGVVVDDPSLDLAVCSAIKASAKDATLDNTMLYYGEVGLTGEIRRGISIKDIEKEAKRLGYSVVSSAKAKYKNIRDL